MQLHMKHMFPISLSASLLTSCTRIRRSISSMAPIKCICIDLSGTLHVEDQATEGAVEALKRLRNTRIPLRFVTNTTKESSRTLLCRLHRIGFQLEASEIYSSLSAARDFVLREQLRPFYLLTDDARQDFPAEVEGDEGEPNAVVVGLAPEKFCYDTMNRAFNILLNPTARLIAIHEGKYYKTSGKGLNLGPGCFVRGLEYSANCKATVVGKPMEYFFRAALPDGIECEECVMIGDDPLDDALGAKNAGMKAILVQTGKYRPEIESKCDHLAANFAAAVDHLIANDFQL